MKMHIDDLREARGLTWDQLAEETGISKPSLLNMSTGKTKQIRAQHIDALCTFFGLKSLDGLVTPEIESIPLVKDPKLQERARKAAAGRWSDGD